MLRQQLWMHCYMSLCRRAAPIVAVLRANSSTLNLQKPILPNVSSLHRTSEFYTPAIEADPQFNKDDISISISERGLGDVFSSDFIEKIAKLQKEAEKAYCEIDKVEAERLCNHREFKVAVKQKNEEVLQKIKIRSKEIKKERANWKELARRARCDFLDGVLQLPNKLLLRQPPPEREPSSTSDGDCSPSFSDSAMHFNQLSGLTLKKNCGEYSTGSLAIFKQREMFALWHSLANQFGGQMGNNQPVLRPCLLSDLVRLPAAEACAWEETNQVIQLQNTKDDIVQPDPKSQPLINPHTRLCLVGSASLAAFTGSLLGCHLEKVTQPPLRFLSLGNIYSYDCASKECLDSPSNYPFKQTKQISLLGVDADEKSSIVTFDQLANDITVFWSQAQPHWSIRLSASPAWQLRRCEMARWSLLVQPKMHLSSSSEIELASVSLLGDWVSRRSGFKLASGNYPSMVFGNLANLDKILSLWANIGVYTPLAACQILPLL